MREFGQLLAAVLLVTVAATVPAASAGTASRVQFHPVNHATLVIHSQSKTIYVDPVGGADLFVRFPDPDIILITHTHRDHLDPETITAIRKPGTIVIANPEATSRIQGARALKNGETATLDSVTIQAVPAYNLTEERLKFHPKGRDNGYVLTLDNERIYLSGDTEDTPEMRALKNIDVAFVCMNLPYTMTVDQAASAVLEFCPRVVIPYHFRGKDKMSDLEAFKKAVAKNETIEVRLLAWY